MDVDGLSTWVCVLWFYWIVSTIDLCNRSSFSHSIALFAFLGSLLFFSYYISCGNINIHHIHIYNDYLCLSNRLNLYYYHLFPMKHVLHLNKLVIICHFMSIQTIDVACIWRCLMWFFTWLCCLYGCHHGLFFLLSTCFHIMIRHPTICAMFINLPCITMCFR